MKLTSGADDGQRPPAAPDANESGWTSVPNLVNASEVERILDDCEALLGLPAPQRSARDKAHGGTLHLDRLDERIALVAEITRRPPLIDAVRLAGRATLRLESVAFRSPQPGYGGQALHIDSTLDDAHTYVTAIVTLCTFDTTNGATRIVPGSQRRPDLWRSANSHQAHPDEILLVGGPGTAFVLAGGLLHSGTPNHSRSARPALQLIWRNEV